MNVVDSNLSGPPETIEECDLDIKGLVESIQDIDAQLSYHKENPESRSPDWRPRAIAAKTYLVRDLQEVKRIKRDIEEAQREAVRRGNEKKKAKRVAEHRERLLLDRKSAEMKARFKALHDWAWESFPDRRDEIMAIDAAARGRGDQ